MIRSIAAFTLLFAVLFGGIAFAQNPITVVKDGIVAEISESIPPTNVDDINAGLTPTKPPEGYETIHQVSPILIAVAYKLNKAPYGTKTPFHIGAKYYMARVEHHYHTPPPANATPEEKKKYKQPWGWHKGCTIYKLKGQQ